MKKTLIAILILQSIRLFSQTIENIQLSGIPYPMHLVNKVLNYQVNQNQLVMVAGPNTNLFRAPTGDFNVDNAPAFMFQPDSDFVLTVSIELSFDNQWDAGAILIRNDSLNWIKYCFEKDYTGVKRVVSVVTRHLSDDCNSIPVEGNKIFYKVAKAKNAVALYCSIDGISWYLIRHTRFETNSNTELGFLAQSPVGQKCEVKFTVIKYEAKSINDPFKGE